MNFQYRHAPSRVLPQRLFVFELANNHMGDIDHGLRVIDEIAAATRGFSASFSDAG